MVLATKDPKKVKGGLAAARVRWGDGPPRMIKIGDLTDPQRRLVLALVAAARKEATLEVSPSAADVDGHADEHRHD